MAKLFVVAAWRNLLRHKVQTLINIGSLAIGLTVFSFAFLYVKQELSYDRGWADGARIHRLLRELRGLPGVADGTYNSILAPDWPLLSDYFSSEIETASRVVFTTAQVKSDTLQNATLWAVDPQFLELFRPAVLDGDLDRALSGPGFIAVEERVAERWGITGHVGERFVFTTLNGGELELELAAIYRLPLPVSSASNISMFALLHEQLLPLFALPGVERYVPWEQSVQVWAKLRTGVEVEDFNARLPAFVQQQIHNYDAALGADGRVSDHLFFRWQPITDIHFNPTAAEAVFGSGDVARVTTFAVIGLLVLLVGCSNSVSLSLAMAIERRREIGVRKAAGALPSDIARQQLGESLLLALLALVPAFGALELLLPPFQTLMPTVRIDATWTDYLLLTLIAGGVGLACGAYPALVLSATRPQAVLRSGAQESAKGRLRLRTVLVAVQFCLASILLIATAALYFQLAFIRERPIGFNVDNVAMLYGSPASTASITALRNELEKVPGITRAIRGSNPPNANMPLTVNNVTLVRSQSDTAEVRAQRQTFDYDFVELMQMRMAAGRDFDARFDAIDTEARTLGDGGDAQVSRILLNETAARQLGFATPEEAINERIYERYLNARSGEVAHRPAQIVGVLEDNLYGSLRRRPAPEYYGSMAGFPDTGFAPILVKYEEAMEDSLQERLQEVAQRVMGQPFSTVLFAEQRVAQAFLQEQNESRLLMICGGLALLMASFGLYGLAAFAIKRQVKEVGVRKVMGANVGTIVGLYLWRFSRPIVFASIAAWPVGTYFVLRWIERFPYQMERAWLVPLCIGTLGAVLLIAMLTVSVITTRAATVNPVRSLRYE